MKQQKVTQSQFINKIDEYLSLVQNGKQSIVVTNNGQPTLIVEPHKDGK